MSSISDIDLDLEKLFQPAWAQEKPATNRFDRFTGNEGVKPERRFNDKPGERRAPRRDSAGGGERRGGAATRRFWFWRSQAGIFARQRPSR